MADEKQPLSNSDFRNLLASMATPARRSSEDATPAPSSSKTPKRREQQPRRKMLETGGGDDEEGSESQKKKSGGGKKPAAVKKAPVEKPVWVTSYRDRASERRKDANPDYNPEAELALTSAFSAVPPPAESMMGVLGVNHLQLSIEQSKYLGGDVEHTHLVKGLDYALLKRLKEEEDEKAQPQGHENKAPKKSILKTAAESAADTVVQTAHGKSLLKALLQFEDVQKHKWGQAGLGESIARKKNPKVVEQFLPGRMSFVYDLDEDARQDIPTTILRPREDCPPPDDRVCLRLNNDILERVSEAFGTLRTGKKKAKKEKETAVAASSSVPALIPLKKEEPKKPMPFDDGDDIFEEVGRTYSYKDGSQEATKEKERRDSGVRFAAKDEYFRDSEGSALRPKTSESLDEIRAANRTAISTAVEKPKVDAPSTVTVAGVNMSAGAPMETDSVEAGKKLSAGITDGYDECYPLTYEGDADARKMVVVDDESDEEPDFTKMDPGNKKEKGKLKPWDFQDDEEWEQYNNSREAMPKAAFQFGVKAEDGRKTRRNNKPKNPDAKINQQLKQIEDIWAKRDEARQAKPDLYDDDDGEESSPKRRKKH